MFDTVCLLAALRLKLHITIPLQILFCDSIQQKNTKYFKIAPTIFPLPLS